MKRKLLFLVITVIATLVISEFLTAKFKPQLIFSKLKSAAFNCYENDSILPFVLKKNTSCQMKDLDGDYDTYAMIDSLGFRGRKYTLEKSKGAKRILMLGDSMTFGIGVSDEDIFSSKLEKMLEDQGKRTEVINAGYADGFSPDSYYLFFKERGLKLNPDVVILNFFIFNDITDLSETVWEKTDSLGLPEKITSCCRIVDEGIFVQKKRPFQYSLPILRDLHLFQLMVSTFEERVSLLKLPQSLIPKRDLLQRCIFNPSCIGEFSKEEESAYRVIRASKKIADENGIKFILVLIPVDFQLYPETWGKYGPEIFTPRQKSDFIQQRIKEKLTQENIPILDLYPVFDAKRDRGFPYFTHDAHFNEIGHSITAEAIYDYLSSSF